MAATKRRLRKRAVAIVRISKDRAEQTSITTQREAIERYCTDEGIELVVVLEERKSAYKESVKLQTPAKALRMVKSGEVDLVLCYRVDRVARRVRDLLNLVHEIEQAGGAFVATSQREFDTTSPWGKALMSILAVLAELESDLKSERILDWQEARRADGLTPTGPTPFGYRRERNQLIIVPELAQLINAMADAVLAGASLKSQLTWLTAQGYPKSMFGVRHVLTSPTTAALREVDGVLVSCSAWEPILTRDRWDALRTVLLDPARRLNFSGSVEPKYLLSGLLECATCKRPMQRKNNPSGLRYACMKCHQSVSMASTDKAVERTLLGLLDPKAWRALQKRATVNHVDIDAVQGEIDNLRAMHEQGVISDRQHELLYADCIERLKASESDAVQLPDVKDPRAAWGEMLMQQKRIFISAVLPRIIIKPTGRGTATPGQGGGRFDESRIVIPMLDDDAAAA